jgi:S-DNA-T family DNA segregation ATPase FtsK/SpoIIIE
MTAISVGSTGRPVGPPGPHGAPGPEPAASGFDVLLAGARPATQPANASTKAPAGAPDADTDATANNDTTAPDLPADATQPADAGDPPKVPTAKADQAADLSGLLAVLAALAWIPTTTATATPVAKAAPLPGADAGKTETATTAAAPVPTDPNAGDAVTLVDLTAGPDLAALIDLTAAPAPPPANPAHPDKLPVSLPPLPIPTASTTPDVSQLPAASAAPVPTLPAATHDHSHPAPPGVAMMALGGPAPTSAMAVNVDADAGTTVTAAVAPPPAEQLVSVLTPLRTSPNGTYTLRLELKPPELGRVEMRVEMKDGVLHASIHTDHAGSAQLVRDAINDLRDHLNAEGVRTGDLTVSDGSVGSGGRDGADASQSQSSPAPAFPLDAGDELAPPIVNPLPASGPESTSLLDVRV